MLAHRQTDRETWSSQYFALLSETRSKYARHVDLVLSSLAKLATVTH